MDGGIVSTSSFPLFQIAIYLTEEELMGWLIEQTQHLNSQFRGEVHSLFGNATQSIQSDYRRLPLIIK